MAVLSVQRPACTWAADRTPLLRAGLAKHPLGKGHIIQPALTGQHRQKDPEGKDHQLATMPSNLLGTLSHVCDLGLVPQSLLLLSCTMETEYDLGEI